MFREEIVTRAGSSTCADVFVACCEAIQHGILIKRVSNSDKEFHFQNWVRDRLRDSGHMCDSAGRNSFPDFTVVHHPEGYEVKGLAWPGREASYDSNSRVPTGEHNGRTVYYVFGRYPKINGDTEYPVVDLVVCHGDFLNANHSYVHKNKSFKGFGSYGDLLVRDRKMYVAPTPFALTSGTTGTQTLIAPETLAGELTLDSRLEPVGELVRVEADRIVTGYTFDLGTNSLTPSFTANPSAQAQHRFIAYRCRGRGSGAVEIRELQQIVDQLPAGDEE
jgi:hypothetical protein